MPGAHTGTGVDDKNQTARTRGACGQTTPARAGNSSYKLVYDDEGDACEIAKTTATLTGLALQGLREQLTPNTGWSLATDRALETIQNLLQYGES